MLARIVAESKRGDLSLAHTLCAQLELSVRCNAQWIKSICCKDSRLLAKYRINIGVANSAEFWNACLCVNYK